MDWYTKNRDVARQHMRDRYREKREEILAQAKIYRREHAAEHKEQRRAHYLKHKKKILEDTQQYQKEHPEVVKKALKRFKLSNPDYNKKRYSTHREERKEMSLTYQHAHREEVAKHARKWRYGLTSEQFEHLLQCAKNKCQICGRAFVPGVGKRSGLCVPHIDHDHATNEIRGVLCTNCNSLLGFAKDSAKILRQGALYLENSLITKTSTVKKGTP